MRIIHHTENLLELVSRVLVFRIMVLRYDEYVAA